MFINLLDNYNEVNQVFPGFVSGSVNDNVAGFTLAEIEANVLPDVDDFNSLANALMVHKPAGVTDFQINQLLQFY